ncbi:PIR protein [Plasmodium vivax]|uniref:VIR protein n=1 Tax=Plasmodium vivax TaxID=5855 RepID=A0A565A5G6_PLAVI|nr:PIR protein [Plasmodium vivax]VUZ99453.1 PIR protein [Plasmodium vivax]
MTCKQNPKEKSYIFFEDIENYIKKGNLDENTDESSSVEGKCNSFMTSYKSHFKVEETAKILCKQFIKLYDSLTELKDYSNRDSNYDKSSEFLNYWLNFKLKENLKSGDDTFCQIYNGIESEFTENRADGVKKTLLLLSNSCCPDYLEAYYMCNVGNNNNNHSQFCTQLGKFKTKYESLYDTEIGRNPEYMNYFKKLSECKNTNVTSTALIGTTVGLIPLMVGLYKFTPLRQLINSKNGKLTQEYRNNDDEMRNIMLMDEQSEQTSSPQGIYNIKYHSV